MGGKERGWSAALSSPSPSLAIGEIKDKMAMPGCPPPVEGSEREQALPVAEGRKNDISSPRLLQERHQPLLALAKGWEKTE
jgi:hypothetical protein